VANWILPPSSINNVTLSHISEEEAEVYWIGDNRSFWFFMETIKGNDTLCLDVEANEWEGLYGWTCLIQVSTPTANFILDCMKIPQEIESSFKKVLESKSIVKVFHGCTNDLTWLQRDFGIYTWPVIDTQIIAKHLLGMSSAGFAEVTENILNIKISKMEKVVGQLSDYRVRPLHSDLIRYATNDSRYLSGIWERVKYTYFGAGQTSSKLDFIVEECRKLVLETLWKTATSRTSFVPPAMSQHELFDTSTRKVYLVKQK
jgi:ribonuclease D